MISSWALLLSTRGLKVRFTGMSAIRLEAGKIIEEIALADGVAALNQLGWRVRHNSEQAVEIAIQAILGNQAEGAPTCKP